MFLSSGDLVTRAIDCLVNVDMGDVPQPEWMVRVKEDYFNGGHSFFRSPDLAVLVDDVVMDGDARAILLIGLGYGADPWWDVAIRLMLKYRSLRLMTSAWAPKRLPQALLHYMSTRGRDRILFASDYPVLSMQRCLDEARKLDLAPEVLDAWLHGN